MEKSQLLSRVVITVMPEDVVRSGGTPKHAMCDERHLCCILAEFEQTSKSFSHKENVGRSRYATLFQ